MMMSDKKMLTQALLHPVRNKAINITQNPIANINRIFNDLAISDNPKNGKMAIKNNAR